MSLYLEEQRPQLRNIPIPLVSEPTQNWQPRPLEQRKPILIKQQVVTNEPAHSFQKEPSVTIQQQFEPSPAQSKAFAGRNFVKTPERAEPFELESSQHQSEQVNGTTVRDIEKQVAHEIRSL